MSREDYYNKTYIKNAIESDLAAGEKLTQIFAYSLTTRRNKIKSIYRSLREGV